jgi:hypothetical protein
MVQTIQREFRSGCVKDRRRPRKINRLKYRCQN